MNEEDYRKLIVAVDVLANLTEAMSDMLHEVLRVSDIEFDIDLKEIDQAMSQGITIVRDITQSVIPELKDDPVEFEVIDGGKE